MRKLSRRKFLRGAALAAAGAAAAACQPKTVIVKETVKETVVVEGEAKVVEKVVTATPLPPGVRKVTVFTGFGTGTDASQIEVHERLVEDFNSAHPEIEFYWLTVPWAERHTKYQTLMAAGMTPELAGPIGVGGTGEYMGGWKDLTPYIEADNYDMSDFFGLTQEIHTYPDQGILGLPLCVYPSVVFYNEDLFDAAGVDYPPHKYGEEYADGDVWTYQKLFEIAKLLTIDSSGNDANSPAFNWEETLQWGWNGWDWMGLKEVATKYGGHPTGVTDDYRTAIMDTPEYVNAAQAVADCTWKWHIWATGEQGGAFYDVAGDPMGSGLVAMWEIHSWMGWAYGSWTEAFNWDVAAIPMVAEVGEPIAVVDADTYTMSKTGANADAAWEVMKWLFEPEQFDILCKNYNCVPARRTLADSWAGDLQEQYPDVDFQVFLDGLEYADRPNHESAIPDGIRVADALGAAWDLIRTGENLNVEEVLANLNTEAQALIDAWWELNPEGW